MKKKVLEVILQYNVHRWRLILCIQKRQFYFF